MTAAEINTDVFPAIKGIGIDSLGRIPVVVYTCRKNEIRLISARKATRKESTQYEEG